MLKLDLLFRSSCFSYLEGLYQKATWDHLLSVTSVTIFITELSYGCQLFIPL